MINFITIILTSITIAFLLIEYFNIGMRLKKLFKIPLHEIKKPYDCRFCLYFWISNIITLSLSFLVIPQISIIIICINAWFAELMEQKYN